MDVTFGDTFVKSLKRLIAHDRWYWKIIDFVRYDCPRFTKNIWAFRKDLYHSYVFDSIGALRFLRTSLKRTANYIELHGNEVDEPRLKKIAKIRRAVELLNYHIGDEFMQLAEKQLNLEVVTNWNFSEPDENGTVSLLDDDSPEDAKNNRLIFDLSTKIEKETWVELVEIIKGQDMEEYSKFKESKAEDEDLWYKWFDGSGLKGWWS